jgi:uncharacterized protein (UPF0210 family)
MKNDIMWVRLDHGMFTVVKSYREFHRKVVKIIPRIKRITNRVWLRITVETAKVERQMASLQMMQETIRQSSTSVGLRSGKVRVVA